MVKFETKHSYIRNFQSPSPFWYIKLLGYYKMWTKIISDKCEIGSCRIRQWPFLRSECVVRAIWKGIQNCTLIETENKESITTISHYLEMRSRNANHFFIFRWQVKLVWIDRWMHIVPSVLYIFSLHYFGKKIVLELCVLLKKHKMRQALRLGILKNSVGMR